MPIRFRCAYCNRLLGIATRKAGTQTTCPHCGYSITVPIPNEDEGKTERMSFEDVEALLGREVTEVAIDSAKARPVAAAPAAPPPSEKPRAAAPPAPVPTAPPPVPRPRPVPPPIPKAESKPGTPDEPPLFEGDVDELLGASPKPEDDGRPRPPATSGMDAMSLDEPPRQIVISTQKATMLVAGVVVLLALAFAIGYVLAPK